MKKINNEVNHVSRGCAWIIQACYLRDAARFTANPVYKRSVIVGKLSPRFVRGKR